MLEDGVKYEFFTVISVDSLLAYENKYYLQVFLYKCVYKVADKGIIDYFGDKLFETDEG